MFSLLSYILQSTIFIASELEVILTHLLGRRIIKALCGVLLVVLSVLSQQNYFWGISSVVRHFCLQIQSMSSQSQLSQLSINACCDNDFFAWCEHLSFWHCSSSLFQLSHQETVHYW